MIELDFVKFLKEKSLTVGSVESFTGGLFASLITGVPGASAIFKGSLITYQNEIKEKILGIDSEDIKLHGVVSKEIAYQMAKNGKDKLNVDICVSFTGNAGPTTLDSLPVGRVFIAVAIKEKIKVYELQMNNMDRNRIREKSSEQAMQIVMDLIRLNINE